jgi:hypothetical protein
MDALKGFKAFNICCLFVVFLSMLQGVVLYISTYFLDSQALTKIDFPPSRLSIFAILLGFSMILESKLKIGVFKSERALIGSVLSLCPQWVGFLFKGSIAAGVIHCILCIILSKTLTTSSGLVQPWISRIAWGNSIILHIVHATFFYAFSRVGKSV